MYKNETFLTPVYRYIIGCIERNGKKDYKKTCNEIRDFFDIWPESKIPHNNLLDVTYELKDSTMRLLSAETEEERYQVWEQEYESMQQTSCSCCVSCTKCRDYYWQEMAEIFFQQVNYMKQQGIYIPVRNIPAKMRNHLMSSKSAAELYSNMSSRNRNLPDDCCMVLKGMSSSTPSLLNGMFDTNQYSGGGFFLRYHGVGIVVDPGYHFLENMHHYGITAADISAVVITHEHIDHNNDMRLLDDLYYVIYKQVNKSLHWYLDEASYNVALIYRKYKTGFDKNAAQLHCVKPHKGKAIEEESSFFIDSNKEIKLECFATEHISSSEKRGEFQSHTFGCQFSFGAEENKRILVYTSDTRYFPELASRFEMPNILIANISSIYEDDLMLVKSKERHLGYYGCYYLLKDLWQIHQNRLPDLTMLSEFWNGEDDIRYDVASYLKSQIGQLTEKEVKVLPAEIGMTLRLLDGTVMCSQCRQFSNRYRVCRPAGYEEKLKIICDDCSY